MSAQGQVVTLAKPDWQHLARMQLISQGRTAGIVHVGLVHQAVIEGSFPAPADPKWMTGVPRTPYFVKNGALEPSHVKKYNKKTNIMHYYSFDKLKFLQCMAKAAGADKARAESPRTKRIMEDCSDWR